MLSLPLPSIERNREGGCKSGDASFDELRMRKSENGIW
jgi:hypothetical protein